MRAILLLTIMLMTGEAQAQPAVTAEIAPQGTLRVAMISGNPMLVTKKPDGTIGGVSVDLGKRIAEKLGLPFKPVLYAGPDAYFASFGKGEWDIAIGPRRAAAEFPAHFTPDFMSVDNIFVSAPGRKFSDVTLVDQPGVKIAVVKGGVTEHFLSKTLTSAKLVPIPIGRDAAVEALRTGKAEAFGGFAHTVYAVADVLPGAQIVPGVFSTVRMTVALPKERSAAAQAKLAEILKEANQAGVVRESLQQAGIKGVRVAQR